MQAEVRRVLALSEAGLAAEEAEVSLREAGLG